jgi:hypothetical protein
MSRSLFPLSEPLQFGIRLLRLPRRAGHQHGTTRYFCFTEPSPITGPPLAFGLGMALACFVHFLYTVRSTVSKKYTKQANRQKTRKYKKKAPHTHTQTIRPKTPAEPGECRIRLRYASSGVLYLSRGPTRFPCSSQGTTTSLRADLYPGGSQPLTTARVSSARPFPLPSANGLGASWTRFYEACTRSFTFVAHGGLSLAYVPS